MIPTFLSDPALPVLRPQCTCCAGYECPVCQAHSGRNPGAKYTRQPPPNAGETRRRVAALLATGEAWTLRALVLRLQRSPGAVVRALHALRDEGEAHHVQAGMRFVWRAGPPTKPRLTRRGRYVSPERAAFYAELQRTGRVYGKHERAYRAEDVVRLGILYYQERDLWPSTYALHEDPALPTPGLVNALFGGLAGYLGACRATLEAEMTHEGRAG